MPALLIKMSISPIGASWSENTDSICAALVTSDAAREKRRAINAWIRTAGGFDGVIDFEQALRDPARPDRLHPAFDSGDHLHPNDAGYAAMAEAVDLRLFAAALGSVSRQ